MAGFNIKCYRSRILYGLRNAYPLIQSLAFLRNTKSIKIFLSLQNDFYGFCVSFVVAHPLTHLVRCHF